MPMERNTIQHYKNVAEKTSCTRVQDLGFTHHIEVASLPTEKQKQFLQLAKVEYCPIGDGYRCFIKINSLWGWHVCTLNTQNSKK